VSSEELKRFLDAKKKPSRVLGDLERHLQAKPKQDRSTTVLHPSEIIKNDWCRRASYYLLHGYPKAGGNPVLRMQSIFDTGHLTHAKWQRWFHEMGWIHGKFTCLVCKKTAWGTALWDCENCGVKGLMEYDEVALVEPKLRIAGHTDGWIKKPTGEEFLIEIKTIGPGTIRAEAPQLMQKHDGDFMKAWGDVSRPFIPHIKQGQMYLELMRRMGNPLEEIVFLYELKADQSYKEFPIKRDPTVVEHVFERAEKLMKRIEDQNPPPCSNNLGGHCAQCSPFKELK
jgi:hypothetical protein